MFWKNIKKLDVFIVLLTACVFSFASGTICYDIGRKDGYASQQSEYEAKLEEEKAASYADGKSDGKSEGYQIGYDAAKRASYDEGYQDGYSDGFDEWFSKGYESGYADGKASVTSSSSFSSGSSYSQPQTVTVYVTNTGSKYHMSGCQYLKKSRIPISLSNAKKQGYTPCSRCNPPR